MSDDEEEEYLLDLEDFEEEGKEETLAEESVGKASEGEEDVEEETDETLTDEPEDKASEGKEDVRPLSRNEFAEFSARLIEMIDNIGIRQQLNFQDF